MHEVARRSGVAIATLYRYFPSKANLFNALMAEHVVGLQSTAAALPQADPADAVADLLIVMTRRLLKHPKLAVAMIQANAMMQSHTAPDDVGEAAFITAQIEGATMRLLGLDAPEEHDQTLVRLLMECWFGAVTAAVSGYSSYERTYADLRVAARVLLGQRSNAELLSPAAAAAPEPPGR